MFRTLVLLLCLLLQLRLTSHGEEKQMLGIEYAISVVYPIKLEPGPVTKKSPVILRVASTETVDEGIRHDLRYMALRPGKHNLTSLLQKEDGTATGPLPAVNVEITSLLPDLHQGDLADVKVSTVRRWFGSYKNLLITVVSAWVIGAIPLLFWKRSRPKPLDQAPEPVPLTLADRIRPLVAKITENQIDTDAKAQLERLVHAFWRKKLQLPEGMDSHQALAALKANTEASPSIRMLEAWLHHPPARRQANTDGLLEEFAKIQDGQSPA